MEIVLKYLIVFAVSMAKFLFGPIIGQQSGLSFIESCIFTILGATSSAIIIMYGGQKVRILLQKYTAEKKRKKIFSKRNRFIVKVWRKYGLYGIAFLTPVLLSPLGGPIIASILGAPLRKTVRYIFFSCLFWGPITTGAIYGLFDFLDDFILYLNCLLYTSDAADD